MTAMTRNALQRKRVVFVLQQNHRFARRLQRKLAVLGGIHLAEWNPAVCVTRRRIEHAELEARAEEATQGVIEFSFGDQLVVDGLAPARKSLPLTIPALEIGTGFHRGGGRVGHVGSIVVAGVHVGDGGAIAHDISVKVPGVAQMIAQQHGAGTGGRPVNGVISAHDRLRVRLGDGRAERGQIGVLKIVRRIHGR